MASAEQNQKEKDRQWRRILVREVTKLRSRPPLPSLSGARRATLPTVKPDSEVQVGTGSPARLLKVRVDAQKLVFATWGGREIRHRLLELTFAGDGDARTPESLTSLPAGSLKDGVIVMARPRGWGDVEDLPELPEEPDPTP